MKAFPTTYRNYDESILTDCTGMTLRDYFAAKAMQALVAKTVSEDEPAEIAAEAAYIFADAMMQAREIND
jgi:hypothetical protein